MKSRIIVPLRCYLKQFPLLRKTQAKLKKGSRNIDHSKKCYDVPLHGSCVVFSKQFVDRRKEVFFPGTFFYYEMEILDYECQMEGYKEVYDPKLKVFHHQNVSTNATYTNEVRRVRFMNQQNLASIKAFLGAFQ